MAPLATTGRRAALEELQIEPLAEFVADLRNVSDFDEAETLVQAKADIIVGGDTCHEYVQIAGARSGDHGSNERRADAVAARLDLDVHRQLG